MKVYNKKVKSLIGKKDEDSLTFNVFSRLSYLPTNIFESILNSLINRTNEFQFINVEEIHFWPNWDARFMGSNRIVPDMFLRLKSFDLIIEAKRYDYGQQSTEQWANEIETYKNKYGSDKKLLFLALGGMNYFNIKETQVTYLERYWSTLHRELYNQVRINRDITTIRILEDIIEIFEIYSFSTPIFFEDLPKNLNISTNSLKIF